jgi:hypothetical protein
MGKVLVFRKPDESCANCWYYIVPRESHWEPDKPAGNYCGHPDRVKDCHLNRVIIEKMGLRRDSGQWCPKYINIDSPVMKKLQSVAGIRFALFNLQRIPGSLPVEKVNTDSDEYRELLDHFYLENKKIMTINQYKAAKRNPDYFITLIDEAFEYYKKKSRNQRHLVRE